MSQTDTTAARKAQRAHAEAAMGAGAVFADVLCAVDGTRDSFTAVRQAAALAGPEGRLTLLAVSATAGAGRYRTAAINPKRIKRVLDIATQIAREADVESARIVEPGGPPSKVIVERAAGHDLLAMGAPKTSWLAGLFVGGVVVSAMRSFTTPLLLARPAPEEQTFARRILIASDATDGSDSLVELAALLAREQRGGVLLVHAAGAESKARPHRIEAQMRTLGAMLPDACEVHVEPGAPQEVIVDVARSAGASLIVMGSRRLDGLRALGSVSERLAHNAPCSVLVVPPPGR
jgi:nucleotide-binding universal stress UspA family protein